VGIAPEATVRAARDSKDRLGKSMFDEGMVRTIRVGIRKICLGKVRIQDRIRSVRLCLSRRKSGESH